MRLAIHQPEYFPWLGFVDKARRVDALVLLDDVQFDRSSLQHRARVVGANGALWLTIPFVHRFPQRIDEVAIADPRFAEKHWKSLAAAYGRGVGWKLAAPRLEAFFSEAAGARLLVDVTARSVELVLEAFGCRARLVRASALAARGEKAALVLAICRELGATTYLSGRSGAAYLDGETFARAGVRLEVQAFAPPPYLRKFPLAPDDARGISALDAWLSLGQEAASALLEGPP